jgi:hypothetical protein
MTKKYVVTAQRWGRELEARFGPDDGTHDLTAAQVVALMVRFGKAEITQHKKARGLATIYQLCFHNVRTVPAQASEDETPASLPQPAPQGLVAIEGGHRAPTKRMADEVETEVRAVFDRHGMGGVVIAAKSDRGGFRPIIPSTMHLSLDPSESNVVLNLNLDDEVGVVRTLRFVGAMHHYAEQCSELFEQIKWDIEEGSGLELEEFEDS